MDSEASDLQDGLGCRIIKCLLFVFFLAFPTMLSLSVQEWQVSFVEDAFVSRRATIQTQETVSV